MITYHTAVAVEIKSGELRNALVARSIIVRIGWVRSLVRLG